MHTLSPNAREVVVCSCTHCHSQPRPEKRRTRREGRRASDSRGREIDDIGCPLCPGKQRGSLLDICLRSHRPPHRIQFPSDDFFSSSSSSLPPPVHPVRRSVLDFSSPRPSVTCDGSGSLITPALIPCIALFLFFAPCVTSGLLPPLVLDLRLHLS